MRVDLHRASIGDERIAEPTQLVAEIADEAEELGIGRRHVASPTQDREGLLVSVGAHQDLGEDLERVRRDGLVAGGALEIGDRALDVAMIVPRHPADEVGLGMAWIERQGPLAGRQSLREAVKTAERLAEVRHGIHVPGSSVMTAS